METRRRIAILCRAVLICMTAASVMASEYRGAVKSGNLPVPGVTVSAVQGDKKLTTTTDQDGTFRFADLADGLWNIDVEMIGFAKVTRPVDVQPGAPLSSWDLKLLTQDELLASIRPKAPASDSAPSPQGPSATPRTLRAGRRRRAMFLKDRSRQGHFLPVAFPRVDHAAGFRRAALRLRVLRQAHQRSRATVHLHRRSRRRTTGPQQSTIRPARHCRDPSAWTDPRRIPAS